MAVPNTRRAAAAPAREAPKPRKPFSIETLRANLVGQDSALETILPYVKMYHAGISPEGRPVGVFLLLGPTGTGKTRTVEVLANALHGSEKHMLKIDCGEFQMEHEVAKLIGAPPGYLGHRETSPLITQQKLNLLTSEASSLSLVLFDEIEKAAPSMTRLLLGLLDKAVLRLGDNTSVSFERSLIFLTSNLGAEAMRKLLVPDFGFGAMTGVTSDTMNKLTSIGVSAAKRKFTPEFVNRIDGVVTYLPLDKDSIDQIVTIQVQELNKHIRSRLDERAFGVTLTQEAREWLIERGFSREYGARELKRVILRNLTQPLAHLIDENEIEPGSTVLVDVLDGKLIFT